MVDRRNNLNTSGVTVEAATDPWHSQALRAKWPLWACLGLLQVSQVLILRPGTSASPWDSVVHGIDPRTFGPLTSQEWALASVAAISLAVWVLSWRSWHVIDYGILAAAAVVSIPAIFTTAGFQAYAGGVGKVLIPLLAYLAVRRLPRAELPLHFIAVNVFVILQTLLAKILTGEFAANSYYRELDGEYFGYFHHPFAFSGILGVCTIVAVHQLFQGEKRTRALQVVLIAANLTLIYASQVRTYLLALAIALAVLAAGHLLKVARRVALMALGLAVVGSAVATLSGIFGQDRAVGDVTSGRFSRWADDMDYFVEAATFTQWLVGGGADFVFYVNQHLSGVFINSLNFFVDALLNFGVIGLVALCAAWGMAMFDSVSRDPGPYTAAMAVFVVTAAIVTSPFEFPALGVFLAVGMAAVPNQPKDQVQ